MKTILKHTLKGFEFIPYEYGFKILTLTKDSFSYPNKTWVASIHTMNKHLSFNHGYFPPHKIGNILADYAKNIGYSINK